MSDFMLMVTEDEAAHASSTPQAAAALIAKQAAFADGVRRSGKLVDAGRLRPSREGKRVRRTGKTTDVTDGPFAGNALGAFYWVQADSADEAARIAADCPTLPSDEVDVRPIMKGRADAEKQEKPGKIFVFGVLGNADTEDAWVGIMDRIDATSKDEPSAPGACGGVRLMPPTTGRRVATATGGRAIFDGPFLESKEIIGGIFFARMSSIEEAVRWATGTSFVELGAVEIRELWRT